MENCLRPIQLYVYSSALPEGRVEGGAESDVVSFAGAGLSSEEAKVRCLGEGVERYCWHHAHRWKDAKVASFGSIRTEAVPPRDYALFSAAQHSGDGFPYVPFHDDTELRWVEGTRLSSQEPVHVPARLCYRDPERSPRICYDTTTGMACSETLSRAIFTAICEVVERDAFTLMWLNRLTPEPIEIGWRDDCDTQRVFRFLDVSDYSCRILRLPNDPAIPVCMTMLVNRRQRSPYVALGLASHLDIERAIEKSLSEALHNLNFQIGCVRKGIRFDWNGGKTRLEKFDEHALLYSDPAMRQHLSFLLETGSGFGRVDLGSTKRDFDFEQGLVDLLRLLGDYPVIAVDLTASTFASLGLHVLRVLIPGFVDLGLDRHYRLDAPRIFEVPRRLGLGSTKEHELNVVPHPFP